MKLAQPPTANSARHDLAGFAGFAGFTLGAVGVLIFSLTMPVTKVALAGDAMSPWFVWAGRAVLAAFAGIVYLWAIGAKAPPRAAWWPLLGTAMGVVFGWPLLNTLALQTVPSNHAAVVNGILPLATAIIGATLNRERLSRVFWLCAIAGTALVCGYAWLRADGTLHVADTLLLLGVLLGGLGYASGAMAAKYLSGPEVISWALILGLPITLLVAALNTPQSVAAVTVSSWFALAYLGLMSQWVGFFFWYRGLLLGGIARVSQVQLVQLFLTLGFSALMLDEPIEPSMLLVATITLSLIFVGRKAA
jgi:drug/metabolite transporter (DMT)-like permease